MGPRGDYLEGLIADDNQSIFSGVTGVTRSSHVSAADSWKEYCDIKKQRMRGRNPNASMQGSPNLSSLRVPLGSSSTQGSVKAFSSANDGSAKSFSVKGSRSPSQATH